MALTRPVSTAIAQCELTHIERQPIDIALARAQHHAYEQTLGRLGCRVESLKEEPDLPDAVFVEDAAVVFDEVAIIALPGAVSRRLETRSVSLALLRYREVAFVEAPGTLDGGDVLCAGKRVFIGLSQRTNTAAIEQVRKELRRHGYAVHAVDVNGCLHLKSAVTVVSPDTILINRKWVERGIFKPLRAIEVDPSEAYAANALWFGGKVIYSPAFSRTAERLREKGMDLELVDLSELAKAEGALTCCSLIFRE